MKQAKKNVVPQQRLQPFMIQKRIMAENLQSAIQNEHRAEVVNVSLMTPEEHAPAIGFYVPTHLDETFDI